MGDETETQQANDRAWEALVAAAREWVNHMDQWEKFRFQTAHGPVYVTITMMVENPNEFDWVGA